MKQHILLIGKEVFMDGCNKCKNAIPFGNVLACPNCGKTFCSDCASQTKKICPHCYHNLEYIG